MSAIDHSSSRPHRFERGLEVLLDRMATLAEAQTRFTEGQTAQRVRSDDHEQAKLNGLIEVVNDFIRRQPKQ